MAETNQSQQAPLLCATGCGFYGNPRTNGMCSICYRDFLQRQNGSSRVSDPVSECFSALGESLSMQSATVTPASALEQNSSQSFETPADEVQVEKASAEAQDELKAEVVAASGPDVSLQCSTTEVDKSKPKKNRCFTCRKKVGLTGFDCRCGNLFCGIHRYSDVHNCTFDYRAEAAAKIRKENPVVAGEKIQKI